MTSNFPGKPIRAREITREEALMIRNEYGVAAKKIEAILSSRKLWNTRNVEDKRGRAQLRRVNDYLNRQWFFFLKISRPRMSERWRPVH